MPRRKEPRIPDAVLDQLLAGADPKTVFDPNGLIDDLKKALAERVLNAEMDHHLAGEEPSNRRNGYGKKTVITDTGQIELEVPRDFPAMSEGSCTHECHRSAECQASTSGQGEGSFSYRQGSDQTPLPGLEPVRKGVDHAAARVV